ncbi:hypothetical protein LCGC14_3039080 [marine sediment metagenome]|uniref:Uncharacterized protein n=1 Tax=marine sediment metagenome TaxID=412755 RepID=A0A0F8YY55_9ZZZZ
MEKQWYKGDGLIDREDGLVGGDVTRGDGGSAGITFGIESTETF